MDGLHFQQPYWFIGLVLPLLWLILSRQKRWSLPELIQPTAIRYPALRLLDKNSALPLLPELPELVTSKGMNFSIAALMMLLIVSLAQPARYGQSLPAENTTDPVDLILVVNTSVSMVLKDYVIDGSQIDRMEMSRRLLQKLVTEFKGHRIGLVVLGRPPSVWLPLTDDRRMMSDAISRLRTSLGGRNSDLGETLTLVKNEFPSTNADTSVNPQQQELSSERTVLLVSDGYSQLGATSPEEAIQQLISAGFKLHTLATGSAQRPEFSLGKGHLIYQPVDLKLMQNLATLGQGEMLHAKDLSVIHELLNSLKASARDQKPATDRKLIIPFYHYSLALALILLLYQLLPVSVTSMSAKSSRS